MAESLVWSFVRFRVGSLAKVPLRDIWPEKARFHQQSESELGIFFVNNCFIHI